MISIKYDSEIFKHLLKKEPKYDTETIPRLSWNQKRFKEDVLTIISNPYCQPCQEAKNQIHALLQVNEELVVEEIIFQDAFGKKNINLEIRDDQTDNLLNHELMERHNKWCVDNSIPRTPYILYNGYHLPNVYEIGDLKYLL